ncbi:MAG TPA: efflux RND transporter permease subunit [Chthonomonadaceae bacterium]|nr:efflux RND transporter permease subunit [Chthonomonadaceae bacterium]
MWLTRLAISRPILIWMALAAIAVLGLQAYFRLPAELNPRVNIPTLTVTTIYPGAGPPEIETQITKPLEEAVGTVGGVKDVYSSSQPNVSIISMDLQVGTDLDVASNEVRARVDAVRAQLPPEARPPVVAKLDINALPILYIGLESPSQTLAQLRALADNTIVPRLERVPGVATVRVVGGVQREIHVAVDEQRLAQYGLTIEDVVNSLKASGRNVPSGEIAQGSRATEVRLIGAYSSLDAIRNTQILAPQLAQRQAQAAAANPQAGLQPAALPEPALTVGDVATVSDGQAERTEINRINGREGVSLVLTKATDANTITVVDQVNAAFRQLEPSLPKDLKRVTLRDDAVTVRAALEDVNGTLILGAILAMVVILFFLHNLRGTFIVSLAIPACIVATFLVMWAAGFTLNQMTLLALSLSVGILVDDSIVVLESITRHLRYGETPTEAAFNGRTEIGFADITTTLVDVVVFVPIAFMGGVVGGFFKQFGLTIAAATLFSLVVSFTVTPMLASRWYKSGEDVEAKRGLFAPFEQFYRWLEGIYRRVIRWALRWRWLVIGLGVAALAGISVVSFFKLGTEFLPGTDQGQIAVNIEMPPGASLQATDAAARRIEQQVVGTPDVEATSTNVGQILGGFGSIPQQGPQFAQINVRLKEKAGLLDRLLHPGGAGGATRARSDQDIATQLRRQLQPLAQQIGGRVTTAAVRSVVGIALPVEIQLRGPDIERLTQFAAQLQQHMRSVPGVLDPDVSVRSGRPEVRVDIDRQAAAQVGVPAGLAGAILRDSVSGNTETVFRQGGQEFPIRVRLQNLQRDNPADVQNILVGYDAQGQPVTLGDVAHISLTTGPTNIDRYNGQRMVTVTANLAPNTPLGNVEAVIQREIDAMPHPDIDVKWGGEAETLNENILPFASALIMAVLLVYIVMASLFNNLGTPFVIMFTLPMALVGALGALVLTGETLSLVAAIGIIMLVGLMGRNAILLLDYTNTLRARGLERNAAIEEAGATRLRPILMTTTATIVGMLPVALRIGRASEIRAPMAIVVIGGLLISTVLTLIVIPSLYSLFDDWLGKRKRRALYGGRSGAARLSGPELAERAGNGVGEPEREQPPTVPPAAR